MSYFFRAFDFSCFRKNFRGSRFLFSAARKDNREPRGDVALTLLKKHRFVQEKTVESVPIKILAPDEKALELQQGGKESFPIESVKTCGICSKQLVGKFAFSNHLKTAHNQGSFPCPICQAEANSGQSFHEHLKLKHKGDPEKVGPKSKTIGTSTVVTKHIIKSSARRTFKCDVPECTVSEVFQSFNVFKAHCLNAHNIFPLACKICDKRYKEQSTFRNHMEAHAGEPNYGCDVCQKKFVTKERLFAHRRLHLGRRFQCTRCNFSAKASNTLHKHIRMKHLTERKFMCQSCDKAFGSKQNLELHCRIHTGEAPYECSLCRLRFKRMHHHKHHLNSASHKEAVQKAKHNRSSDNMSPENAVAGLGLGDGQTDVKSKPKAQELPFKKPWSHVVPSSGTFGGFSTLLPIVSDQPLTMTSSSIPGITMAGKTLISPIKFATTPTLTTSGFKPIRQKPPSTNVGGANEPEELSLVVPLSFDQDLSNDEDLINLADNSDATSGLFLDDNVQLIIVSRDEEEESRIEQKQEDAELLTASTTPTDKPEEPIFQ